jgi:surfeit locus 1 family protein
MKPAAPPVQRSRRLWPGLAALLVVVATLLLGRWQLHRAAEKTALQTLLVAREQQATLDLNALAEAPVDADAVRFRVAQARGLYLPEGQIYIDNRSQDGVPGYHVLTPLQLGAHVVLVNRGFLARDASYPRPPQVAVPQGEQSVSGLLAPGRSRFLELSQDTVNGAVWQNLKLDRYAALTHLAPLPVVLLVAPAGNGLLPVVETPDTGIDTHLGYAFQWFCLAATTAGLYLYFNFIRKARPVP